MRFNTLDGLRGIAAILVLFYHLGGHSPIAAPAGYLAVDLFFGLSGFVIALAYDARLRAGLSFGEFALLRLVRVYPMALLGAAIGVALSGRFLPSLLLVPDFAGIGAPYPVLNGLYPANIPLWSLALELVVNFAFAIVALRAGWRALAGILAVSAAVLAVGAIRYDLSELGGFWATVGFGLARTVFSFALGVGMQRLQVHFAIRRRETRLAWLLPLALIGLLTQVPAHDAGWNFACVFVLLPLLLWLGTIWETPHTRLFAELGGLSYPLYCIHGAFVQMYSARPAGPPAYLWIALIAAAWWLNNRIDAPLRSQLMTTLKRRRLVTAKA